MSASRLWQLRQYVNDRDPFDLAGRLRTRASRKLFHVHSSLLEQLLGDESVLRAGVSAVSDVKADLWVHDDVAEVYVHDRDMAALESDYFLSSSEHIVNVIAHVVAHAVEIPFHGSAPRALVALDLMESGDPRSVDAGRRLWREALDAVRS